MEHAHLKRRLSAVLLADVVGYSRLMSADEEATHVRLASHVKEVIEPRIAEYLGRPIRSMGDGLLAEFDSAVDAVRCALAIQRELTDREAGVAPNRRIRMRIGINAGDVIVDERDIYGHSVNIAARLEGLAEPGEVYVTRNVRDQLEGHPSLLLEDKGERRAKNINRPIRVYRVRQIQGQRPVLSQRLAASIRRLLRTEHGPSWRSAALLAVALAATAGVTVAALPIRGDYSILSRRASIMVLPFRNASGNPEEDYFADAVTNDLTTDLSRLSETSVISPATAFAYKGKPVDAREVGRKFDVRYLLEGSIQKTGMKVRTNAQLVDTRTAAQIWADRFENEVGDLLELQEAVIGRIATSLDVQLVKAENRRAMSDRPADPDALDLRLRATAIYLSSVTPEHSLAAQRLLRDAVRIDPQSAEAWAWLADALASDFLTRWNGAGPEQLAQAQEAVGHALAINPSLALAHHVNGLILRTQGEHHAALDAFDRALQLNPSYARAYAQKGNQMINIGQPLRAPPLVEKAIRLSPNDPSLGQFYWILGRAYFYAERYREAVPWLRKSVEVRPNIWFNKVFLASAYYHAGEGDQARKTLQEPAANSKFGAFTLEHVVSAEQVNPNDNPVIVAGRAKLHEGLLAAGMPAR